MATDENKITVDRQALADLLEGLSFVIDEDDVRKSGLDLASYKKGFVAAMVATDLRIQKLLKA